MMDSIELHEAVSGF